MPRGTPYLMKCPKCHTFEYGHTRDGLGVHRIGEVERKVSCTKHPGATSGPGFRGHRGRVMCLDCGHEWWSIHPSSGRIACDGDRCTTCQRKS